MVMSPVPEFARLAYPERVRETWGWFHFFGYWTINSLNVSNWQSPNTFLTYGLSVPQSLCVIVVGRALICFFSTLVAWCGLRWHIGFTIQNRYTWGMRGSYIPLLQRILLNFICVCITAIWPSFASMSNTLPSSMPTTHLPVRRFIVFWCLSFPFLLVRPEKFKLPSRFTSIYCGLGMICMLIWSLATAKGVGPLWSQGQTIPENLLLEHLPWLMMRGINQMIGGIAAGITNGSDFSRYARGPKHYVAGTITSAWITGTLVSLVGLVVTSACQKIYGEVFWNPPDLLMRMMDSGHGSSKARAGVFFLAAGFALTGMFENVCGNAVAGGIDLAGLFPKYIDIKRGAMVTFVAVWIVQPWQLDQQGCDVRLGAEVRSPSFLSPIMGVMEKGNAPRALYELYFMAFLVGFLRYGEYDQSDIYGTFTPKEAAALNVIPINGGVQEIQGYSPESEKEPRETVNEQGIMIKLHRWRAVGRTIKD
ncbi:ncs1 nucleoside transporter family protein [Botryosphaeria dothidea]|uniref:Ncs1 nucleoside transporter family protein n=1 Tax=Botryosphaeria dothidea TaxID=55169 RepID=A0A8H4IR72_9PEZI|nr:ncs1 nucleoside transporter family protein [Botryosphaeria dothidea]